MGQFDDETAIEPDIGGGWTTMLSDAWSIGANPNGGYAVQPVLRALEAQADRPDPASVTVHYLRPALAGVHGRIDTRIVRSGRRATNVIGELTQDGEARLTVSAILTDLTEPASEAPDPGLTPPRPDIPEPARCVDRAELNQGVELPLLSRVEVRVRPPHPERQGAVVEGWIRLRDGSAPTSAALVLFADAFPPALHSVVERVGWVPTLEFTAHVRRRPVAGWVQAHIECDDVAGGWMIETATLWDASGAVVARARQLGLLFPPS